MGFDFQYGDSGGVVGLGGVVETEAGVILFGLGFDFMLHIGCSAE